MNLLHKLITFILLLVLGSIGAVLVNSAWSVESWDATLVLIKNVRILAAIAGLVFFGLILLFLLSAIPRKKKRRFLSFDDKAGTTSISTEAIADYIGKLSEEFPSVVRLRTKVIPRKHSVDIIAIVRVRAGSQVHEMCELMQERIRNAMMEGLGITEIRRIEVSVEEIASERKAD